MSFIQQHINKFVFSLFLVLGTIAYINSFEVPFYFDDADNIKHPDLRIEAISMESVSTAIAGGTIPTRPISNFSFGLNYYLGEYRVQGYHLVNLLIHVLTAFLLFCLVNEMVRLDEKSIYAKNRVLISFSTALLWLLHPTATQSVTYIVQRMNSLAAMFYVMCILLYVYGRIQHKTDGVRPERSSIWLFYILSLLSGLLAIGSKETAATLPVTVFMVEWFFIQKLSFKWFRKGILIFFIPLSFIFSLAWIYTGGRIIERTLQGFGGRDFSLEERLFTELRVVIHYISLFLYPHPGRLTFDYDFPLSTSLLSPLSTLYAALLLTAFLIAAIFLTQKQRLLSFCIFWFFITLSIESTIVPLEIIYEHRLYLPLMMLILAVVLILYGAIRNASVVLCIIFGISLVFMQWTIERNDVWRTPLLFWQDAVRKTPRNERVHANLGGVYFNLKEYDKAILHYTTSITLNPGRPNAYSGLGAVWAKLDDEEKAEYYFSKALSAQSSYTPALLSIGRLMFRQGRYLSVIGYMKTLVNHNMDIGFVVEAYRMLGSSYLKKGLLGEAREAFEKALELSGDDFGALNGLAQVLALSGDLQGAIGICNKSLGINGDQPDVSYNLAVALLRSGRNDEAIQYLEIAATEVENPPPALYTYANYLLQSDQPEKAEKYYHKFLGDTRLLADSLNNLGLIMAERKKFAKAADYFTLAIGLDPEHSKAGSNLNLAVELGKDN